MLGLVVATPHIPIAVFGQERGRLDVDLDIGSSDNRVPRKELARVVPVEVLHLSAL